MSMKPMDDGIGCLNASSVASLLLVNQTLFIDSIRRELMDCSLQYLNLESALRIRKRSKSKSKQGNEIHEVSPASVWFKTVKANNLSHGRQISPFVFYGSPHGVPPKRPISLLRLLREIRIDLAEQQKSNLRTEVWATFPRQNEAMNFAKRAREWFAYADLLNFRYKSMDSKFRHHYEVIQEGLPCHLYFDLEFSKRENRKTWDEMVDLLTSVILEALLEKYSIQGNLEWIVELDSSTAEKFSRHLIIRIPKAAFKDNSHAGAFVSECEEDMFMASLICNMDADCEKLLVCKMDLDCVKTLILIQRRFNTSRGNDASTTYTTGKSPFPYLDNFVESIASIGSVSGKIRSWYWFSEYGLTVYSMSRNRYCERIGRQHKSNHVIYVVDLRRAIYYQKCHDPDCQGYRSPLRPIPINLIPDPSFSYDPVQVVHHMGLSNDNLEYQSVNNNCGGVLLYNDDHDTDNFTKDSWWLEAVKVADDIESKRKTVELSTVNNIDEDDNWWIAVERTASQAELMHF
ncbi:hypothetical protein GH714_040041 [Hevea brasiliensis]|uniref:DNA-directed primase/polymerase protein n=1 Tax=Hevea brasiliensis TaxID=3981 RepID=A0A6A6MPH9_HEVBR|nr:hypothetical protein GH714_040041 [Hevea brasiliensis]